MAQWPPTVVAPIPDSGATWPTRVEVGPVTLIGPTAENQQPSALTTRTESLRNLLNTLVAINNVIRDHFLDRDGDDAAIEGSVQGPVYMRGRFDTGGNKIVRLADGVSAQDAVTIQQLETVQFSAEDDVEQVLQSRVVFQDGSASMIANLPAGGNRVIALDVALVSTDASRKDYVDTSISALNSTLVPLTGSGGMTGNLNMDGDNPLEPGFKIINVADPTASGNIVNKRYLDEQAGLIGVEDVPIAAVLPFAGPPSAIPAKFLICDGREVSRFTYQNLFNIIGIAYGPPSSGSVFRLPDLRGRTVIGIDNMGGQSADVVTQSFADALGGKGGTERHQLQPNELSVHTHTYADISYAYDQGGSEQGDVALAPSGSWQYDSTVRDTNLNGGGVAHPNMQPSMFCNWIIRT